MARKIINKRVPEKKETERRPTLIVNKKEHSDFLNKLQKIILDINPEIAHFTKKEVETRQAIAVFSLKQLLKEIETSNTLTISEKEDLKPRVKKWISAYEKVESKILKKMEKEHK